MKRKAKFGHIKAGDEVVIERHNGELRRGRAEAVDLRNNTISVRWGHRRDRFTIKTGKGYGTRLVVPSPDEIERWDLILEMRECQLWHLLSLEQLRRIRAELDAATTPTERPAT